MAVFRKPVARRRLQAGFSLPELLVSLMLAGLVSAALLQVLLVETQASQRMGRLLRERQLGQRALELLRQEIQQAEWVSPQLRRSDITPCSLAGRQVVLQLGTRSGVITYSQGPAPDQIWRGRVLLRCGPAYGLDGALASSTPQQRVLLDALAQDGLVAEESAQAGVLQLTLRRELAGGQQLEQHLPLLAAID